MLINFPTFKSADNFLIDGLGRFPALGSRWQFQCVLCCGGRLHWTIVPKSPLELDTRLAHVLNVFVRNAKLVVNVVNENFRSFLKLRQVALFY